MDYKSGQVKGLQIGAVGITNWGKSKDYKSGQKDYKTGQGLQIGAKGLQIGAGITKRGRDYKSVQHSNFQNLHKMYVPYFWALIEASMTNIDETTAFWKR